MIRAEIFLGDLYASMAGNDPEREAVQGLLLSTSAYNNKKAVGSPTVLTETPAVIITPQERDRQLRDAPHPYCSHGFFGKLY